LIDSNTVSCSFIRGV